MNQARGPTIALKKIQSFESCHVTVLLLKPSRSEVPQRIYDALLANGQISIGNIFEVSDNPTEIEDQLSQIIQMQETMTLLNPNVRHLLLIVEISQHLAAMQQHMEATMIHLGGRPQNLGVTQALQEQIIFPTVYTEATNEYNGNKINRMLPLGHTIRCMLPVMESQNKRQKEKNTSTDIMIVTNQFESKGIKNYLYYLALQEGFARCIYSIFMSVSVDQIISGKTEHIQFMVQVLQDMINILQSQQ